MWETNNREGNMVNRKYFRELGGLQKPHKPENETGRGDPAWPWEWVLTAAQEGDQIVGESKKRASV